MIKKYPIVIKTQMREIPVGTATLEFESVYDADWNRKEIRKIIIESFDINLKKGEVVFEK